MNQLGEGTAADLFLFVSGISSKATSDEVTQFFRMAGHIRLLRLRSTRKGSRLIEANPQNNIRRGFCILEAADPQTFDKVMGMLGCLFKGKPLAITRLRGQSEFLEYSKELARKCVLVSEVPKAFSPKYLVEILEANFGSIRKSMNMKQSKKGKSTVFGQPRQILVEFFDEYSALAAINHKVLEVFIKDKRIEVILSSYEKRTFTGSSALRFDSLIQNYNSATSGKQIKQSSDYEDQFPLPFHKKLVQERVSDHFSKPTSKFYLRPVLHKAGMAPEGASSQNQDPLRFNLVPRLNR